MSFLYAQATLLYFKICASYLAKYHRECDLMPCIPFYYHCIWLPFHFICQTDARSRRCFISGRNVSFAGHVA